jgi:hypothetical protein
MGDSVMGYPGNMNVTCSMLDSLFLQMLSCD